MSSEHQDIESKYQITHTPPVVAAPTIANPGPLGLCGFALTTFVLSLHNAGLGVKTDGPHGVVTGLAFFYGGLVQLLAGMWEFKTGNTFGATAFSSYGGFWLSFGLMYVPGAGTGIDSYADKDVFSQSLGYYLLGWTIFTGIMLIASHRSNIGLIVLFFFLFITFILLTAGKLNHSLPLNVAGGSFGIVTAIIAWYNALSGLLTKESSYFTLPIGRIN
ncbi:GPR1/FUN34/yaaH family-domain-containing protein [Pilobolus umbonatus]|nr:GPR1/FUN34/yaaH family-domain-containing protein [Pilobolus umbonatus]